MRASYSSCFYTTNVELAEKDHLFVLGFELAQASTISQILIVQDVFETYIRDPTQFFMNFEVYIGPNEDYTKNNKCPGGPWMKDGN